MKRLACVLLLAAGTIPFAHGQDAKQKEEFFPIVFDDWWNVDFVKNGCDMQASEAKRQNPYAKPCPVGSDPAEIVKDFENKLEVAFASENECHGLTLTHLSPAMINSAVKNPNAPATGSMATVAGGKYWSLILDLHGWTTNQEGQDWTLVGLRRQVNH